MLRQILIGISLTGLTACASMTNIDSKREPSLAETYKPYFRIGAAVDAESYKTHRKLLVKHFNSMTTENEMKFEHLQPEQGHFTFEPADAMLKFARKHDMTTRGHALVWHRQTPDWVFENGDGSKVSADELRTRMQKHITTVMQHFKGKVDAWDVVNESVMDDGSLRTHQETADDQKSSWYGILGESYIEDAFRFAAAADPEAKLFYNDYYNHLPARHNAIYSLLKELKQKGVRVDGVGLQAHLNVEPSSDPTHQSHYQTIENLEKAIRLYASLGLEVHITELDLSVYVGGHPYEEADYYTPETFDEKMQAQQAERYRQLFAMFRRNADVITHVTFWGIADDNTWLSEFDSGRQDFPMLFDVNHRPKPAFHSVIDFQ